MATYKTALYQKQNGEVAGNTKAQIGDINGRARMIVFSGAFEANVIAIADVVKLCKVPAGARLLDFRIYIGDVGTTGVFKMGWAASAESTPVEAADSTGLAATITATTAVDTAMAGSVTGFLKRFSSGVDIQLEATTATDAALAITYSGYVLYGLD